MIYFTFLLGLLLLMAGANLLVNGASRIARTLGLTPLVIGLTIVALGTSAPEFVVSIVAATSGNPELSVGNVVGSNIFNILFILGISAIIAPLTVSQQLIRLDIPFMIGISALIFFLGFDEMLTWWEGIILLTLGIVYTYWIIRKGQKLEPDPTAPYVQVVSKRSGQFYLYIFYVISGIFFLILGSRLFVQSAITIATQLGVSNLVIGLTIVAAGTSLPEAATSIAATIRNEKDISIGNIIGSNIFNILYILGSSSILSKNGLMVPKNAINVDFPVMFGAALICLPLAFTGRKIDRWEGALFLLCYVGYTLFIIIYST